MSLAPQLHLIGEGAKSKIPSDVRAVMAQATATLRSSGIVAGTIKIGARRPAFSLPSAGGNSVSSSGLAGQRPARAERFSRSLVTLLPSRALRFAGNCDPATGAGRPCGGGVAAAA